MNYTYEVLLFKDNTYEVLKTQKHILDRENVNLTDSVIDSFIDGTDREEEKVYQGSISDCEAWIRLKTNGYLY